MPTLQSHDNLGLHYTVDDFTDPWENRPVLILQHGNGRHGEFWYRMVPFLARHFRVVRPDMRGLGQSQVPDNLEDDLTLTNLITDIKTLLDALGVESVHFCGESMGGILGMAFATEHPSAVRSLTLVSTPVFIEEQMKQRYALGHGSRLDAMREMGIAAWVDKTTRGTRLPADEEPGLFNWYVELFSRGDPKVQVAMSALVNQANAASLLPQIKAPVLGLYPTKGQITSETQEQMLVDGLADFRIVHMPTPYHMVHMLYPNECAQALIEFCTNCD
jgi:3-oxoadipate enol-lactonase